MARLATRYPSLYPLALGLLKSGNDLHRRHAIHSIAVILCGSNVTQPVKPKRRKLTEEEFCDVAFACPITSELELMAKNENEEKVGLRDSIRLLSSLVEIHVRAPDKYDAEEGRKEFISSLQHVLKVC